MGSHFKRVEMEVGGLNLTPSRTQNHPDRSRSVSVFLRTQASWGLMKGSPYLRRESVAWRSNRWPRWKGIEKEGVSFSKPDFSLLATDVCCPDRSWAFPEVPKAKEILCSASDRAQWRRCLYLQRPGSHWLRTNWFCAGGPWLSHKCHAGPLFVE